MTVSVRRDAGRWCRKCGQAQSAIPLRAASRAPVPPAAPAIDLQAASTESQGAAPVHHWQLGCRKDTMRVDQLKAPVVFRYSVVYQKVQSSTGSTVIAL
jgi:hypothetical protein